MRRLESGANASILGARTLQRSVNDFVQVLADFRAGLFNTLVATCIGEEGLDIPQVRLHPFSTRI